MIKPNIKLLFRAPSPMDSVSFYRGFGVLGHLRSIMNLDCIHTTDFNWPTLAMFDAVYLIRPSADKERDIVDMIKINNKPLWVDYDDLVLGVPNSNMAHVFYEQDHIKENIKYILSRADVVTVSTDYLASQFNPFRPPNKPCVVIPNAFPSNYINLDRPAVPRQKILSWRGSRTHDKDLWLAHEFFEMMVKDFPEWKFVFLGEPDWRTTDLIPKDRLKIINSTGILEYFEIFHSIGSSIHFIPLEDNPFNRSKSNIAWLEATYAGSACIAPNFDEWLMPGISHDVLEIFTSKLDLRVNQSKNLIREYLMIDRVNQSRKLLLEELV